jgi:hypothetical protein
VSTRRFPQPWSVEERPAAFVVCDHDGQPLAYVYLKEEPGWRAAAKLWVQQGCHLSTELTMAAQFLFHRDPKRIVGILRVTILNRLNGAREWAELPSVVRPRTTTGCRVNRGLQTPLFILLWHRTGSLLQPKCQGLEPDAAPEKRCNRAVCSVSWWLGMRVRLFLEKSRAERAEARSSYSAESKPAPSMKRGTWVIYRLAALSRWKSPSVVR